MPRLLPMAGQKADMSVALTDAQEGIVCAPGDFLLIACPGSGKTRASAARIARLQSEGLTVAACSYTNVGADRIASTLAADHRVYLGSQHFNGTLHRLLLGFVVHPFAYLMGTSQPVRMWTGDWPVVRFNNDPKRPIPLDYFRRQPNGDLELSKDPRWLVDQHADVIEQLSEVVINRKRGIFHAYGALTADDAMWIAFRILDQRPDLAKVIARRFDELLIDEAQDTSQMQLECLRRLRASGELESFVMVGDLEQSIHEYQGSSAEACKDFAASVGLRTELIGENHRSSQKLCDVAANFCDRSADTAVGHHKDCDLDPEVTLYPPSEPGQAMVAFRERLAVHGIDVSNAAVLARSRNMTHRLAGKTGSIDLQGRHLALGQIAARLEAGTLSRSDVQRVGAILDYGAHGEREPEDMDDDLRLRVRDVTGSFLTSLPPLDGTVKEWIIAVRDPFSRAINELSPSPAKKAGNLLKTKADQETVDARAFFAPPPPDLQPQTIHSLKGEDREAVMLVVNRPAGDRSQQLAIFELAAGGQAIPDDQHQERRVNYVAITRAERYCLIALPDNQRGKAVADGAVQMGFSRV